MLLGFLEKQLLEHTTASETTITILIVLLAIGLFNYMRIHPTSYVSGRWATFWNLVLPGLGQVYMKQMLLGIPLIVLFMGSFLVRHRLPLTEDQLALYFLFLLGLPLALQYILINYAKKTISSPWLHKIALLKYKRLVPLIERGTVLCLDTNILMHEQLLLIAAFRDSDVHLFVSKQVYAELDGLKKNKRYDVRSRAQLAFDLIELYQSAGRLTLLEVPYHYLRSEGLMNSPDERIIGTYLYEQKYISNPLVFLSNDKGARILAKNLNMATVIV